MPTPALTVGQLVEAVHAYKESDGHPSAAAKMIGISCWSAREHHIARVPIGGMGFPIALAGLLVELRNWLCRAALGAGFHTNGLV